MPGDKIGVEVRREYVLDLERVLGGKGNVLVRVPLRVNDGSRACRLVSNNVGSVRQARQIELLENHCTPSSLADCYLGWGVPAMQLMQNMTPIMPTRVNALTSMPSNAEPMKSSTASMSLVTRVIRSPVRVSSY